MASAKQLARAAREARLAIEEKADRPVAKFSRADEKDATRVPRSGTKEVTKAPAPSMSEDEAYDDALAVKAARRAARRAAKAAKLAEEQAASMATDETTTANAAGGAGAPQKEASKQAEAPKDVVSEAPADAPKAEEVVVPTPDEVEAARLAFKKELEKLLPSSDLKTFLERGMAVAYACYDYFKVDTVAHAPIFPPFKLAGLKDGQYVIQYEKFDLSDVNALEVKRRCHLKAVGAVHMVELKDGALGIRAYTLTHSYYASSLRTTKLEGQLHLVTSLIKTLADITPIGLVPAIMAGQLMESLKALAKTEKAVMEKLVGLLTELKEMTTQEFLKFGVSADSRMHALMCWACQVRFADIPLTQVLGALTESELATPEVVSHVLAQSPYVHLPLAEQTAKPVVDNKGEPLSAVLLSSLKLEDTVFCTASAAQEGQLMLLTQPTLKVYTQEPYLKRFGKNKEVLLDSQAPFPMAVGDLRVMAKLLSKGAKKTGDGPATTAGGDGGAGSKKRPVL